ncbi:hypothetical protein M8J76_011037 [Diaphorina citri]|nr:hypothetical protein M8J76_011037 [Diaphorina citri]
MFKIPAGSGPLLFRNFGPDKPPRYGPATKTGKSLPIGTFPDVSDTSSYFRVNSMPPQFNTIECDDPSDVMRGVELPAQTV